MAKIDPLDDVGSLANTTSARAVINNNSQKIEEALANTVSRDGSAPNQMEADFDLNDHYLLNVADPVNDADGVNLRSVRPLVEQFAAQIVETAVFGTQIVDPFTATPGQTDFPLSEPPGAIENVSLFIDELAKLPGTDFTLTGSTLQTLVVTPALSGGETVLIRYTKALPSGIAEASSVVYEPASGNPAITVDAYLDSLNTAGATSGASLVKFVQDGAGAVSRSVQEELRDTLSAAQFGFSTSASAADNAAALGDAIDRAIVLGLSEIKLPAGFFNVGSTITKSISAVKGFSFIGEGADITEICFTQADGNGFNLTMGNDNWYADVDNHNAIHFQDLTICSTADDAGTLVYIDGGSKEGQTKPPVFFSRVVLRSANLDKNPAKLVHLHDCGNANFTDVVFNAARVINVNNGGDGCTISATDGTTDPTSYMFTGCRFLGNRGIVSGDYAEGIYTTNCEFLSRKAVVWSAPGGGESGLHILGGHINHVDGGVECSGIYHALIQGVLFFRQNTTTNNARYVSMTGGASIVISENNFVGANGTGEELIRIDSVPDSDGNGVLIEANQFSNTATAIKLTSTARRVQVGVSNQYLNCFLKVVDDAAGTNRNYVGKRHYTSSIVPSLTGGAATETLDVAIPVGIFDSKPTTALLIGSGNNMIGYYDYDSASSTATNARFLLRPLSGNVPAGLARFSFSVDE
jgi:hypothetical protein